MKNKFFSCLFLLPILCSVLAAGENLLPPAPGPLVVWQAPAFMGKDFWVWLNMPERYAAAMQKVLQEPMTQDTVKTYDLGTSLFEREKPLYNRLLIREIALFDGDRNLSSLASVDGWADQAQIKYLERVCDGDPSPQSACFSAPALAGKDQGAWIAFTFAQPQRLDKVIISSGRERVAGSPDYVHLASRFVLQAKINGSWRNVPDTERKGNVHPEISLSFRPLSSDAFRLYVYEQSTPLLVSCQKLLEKDFPKTTPFCIGIRASRPPFNCFEDTLYDSEGYQQWKEQHPNFIGFDAASEWDNEFINFLAFPRDLDKIMTRSGSSNTVKKTIQEKIFQPRDRMSALAGLKTYHQAIVRHFFADTEKLIFMNCLMAFNHYAMEWGGGMISIETTSSGSHRHQPQMMFARGASRQYHKPWSWYIALGFNGRDDNGKLVYTDPVYTGQRSGGPDWGISPSLNMRDRYMAYLSGASHLRSEVWPHAYCQDKDGDGIWELSPHGEVMKEWDDFVRKNPRGHSYAPVALCLPFSHGQSPIMGGKIWGRIDAARSDHQVEACLRTLVPWNAHRGGQEWAYSNNPYGDLYDVILPAPPSGPVSLEILRQYQILFFAGDIDSSPEFAKRLQKYVFQGGTVVFNTQQLNAHFSSDFLGAQLSGRKLTLSSPVKSLLDQTLIPVPQAYSLEELKLTTARPILLDSADKVIACSQDYGKGRVLLTTTDFLMPDDIGRLDLPNHSKWSKGEPKFPLLEYLFGRISSEVLPFSLTGDIQFGVNQMPDGWLIYLINNEGIYKKIKEPQRLDPNKTASVNIQLKKLQTTAIRELRSGEAIPWQQDSNSFTVKVAPGDVRVYRIFCEKDGQ
ncbi:MAG: hypothetical protein WCT05_01925 [Lentisphaeria bacterium]